MRVRKQPQDPAASAVLAEAIDLRWNAGRAAALDVPSRAQSCLRRAQEIEAGYETPAIVDAYLAADYEELLQAQSVAELAAAHREVVARRSARQQAAASLGAAP